MSLRNYGDSFLLVARTVQTIHFPRSCPIMLLPRSGCLLLIFIISVCRESAAVVARGMNSAGVFQFNSISSVAGACMQAAAAAA